MRGLLTRSGRTLAPKTRFYRFSTTGLILLGILTVGGHLPARASAPEHAPPNGQALSAHSRQNSAALMTPILASLHLPEVQGNEDSEQEDSEESARQRIKELFLTSADVQRYQTIFTIQEEANWEEADKLISELQDERLLGHVLFQRYMHPTGYRTSYTELSSWLSSYSDHPGTKRLHRLAQRRQPAKTSNPVRPLAPVSYIRGGLPSAATMASIELPAWREGLKFWQEDDYEGALHHFKKVANAKRATPWEHSAGAYWTARCLTRLRRPAEVSAWLRRAAAHKRTFYGLIATHQLGLNTNFNWQIPKLSLNHLNTLARHPGGFRALALLQLNRRDMAEQELRRLDLDNDTQLKEALLAISSAAGLANLSLRIGTTVTTEEGSLYDAALYPLPQWRPDHGFHIEKSLIFALMRQESHFVPTAKSQAGAMGLMQLMPTTASYVAGRRFTRDTLDELTNPGTNITLGQKYIERLLKRRDVNGNLFFALAAYNSGPTQLNRWKRKMGVTTDPLLFLETLPAAETRDFTERVLANYWIYQKRMGYEVKTLEQIVAGNWPMYDHENAPVVRVAESFPSHTQ